MSIQTINPATGERIKEFEPFDQNQITEAIESAHQTYHSWRKTDFNHRSKHMKKASEYLRSNRMELAAIITLEMGKIMRESEAEIDKCAWVCDYYAEKAAGFLADEKLDAEKEAHIYYDPLGVVLAVMPWNFPFWQVFRFAAPALMAGNTGLLKHASNVPQCALAIERVFEEAGFPTGSFTSLLIESKQVNQVIDHPFVKAVTLTGSEKAGSKVAERAGANLKKTVLELGGSDPFIVLADADIEKAAKIAVKSRMINCGQSCIAAKRFIVEENIADEFLSHMKKELAALQKGDPRNKESDYGPMARKDLAEELQEQVDATIQQGARVVVDGGLENGKGVYFNPLILADIPAESPAAKEELFGPVASVFVVKSEEDAISLANQSPYGLGSSLWTSSRERAERLAHQIESGAVFVNQLVASSPDTPFGGVKRSGYGRELYYLGIREFMNIKSVVF